MALLQGQERFYVNFEFRPTVTYYLTDFWHFAPFYTILSVIIFAAFRLYGGMWRYSMYDKGQIDQLIDIYFEEDGGCDKATRAKIYCYVAICGLLWSNWCEYKRNLGVEFGEYSLYQYRYGKDFYRYAIELMKEIGEELE